MITYQTELIDPLQCIEKGGTGIVLASNFEGVQRLGPSSAIMFPFVFIKL